MKLFDNISEIVRDDLAKTTRKGSKVSIAAACFSMYAYNELQKQLEGVTELGFSNAEAVDRILPNIDNDMMRRNITLRQMCHVNENGEGDSFVGVKADTDGMTVYFPIGYELPEDDDDLRIDVSKLYCARHKRSPPSSL